MKKTIMMILAIALVFSFAACAGDAAEMEQTPAVTATPKATSAPTSEPTPEPTPTPALTPVPTDEQGSGEPADYLGQEYNPFFGIEWPDGFTINGYYIEVGKNDEDVEKTGRYCLTLDTIAPVQFVVEYLATLTGDKTDVSGNVRIIENGEHAELNGYIKQMEKDVHIEIKESFYYPGILRVKAFVNLDELADYEALLDKNFDEDIIKDWGGMDSLFEIKEPVVTTMEYSVEPIESFRNAKLVCFRVYNAGEKAQEYAAKLVDANNGEYNSWDPCNGGSDDFGEMTIELKGGDLVVQFNGEFIIFYISANSADKNICDYDWQI